MLPAPPPGLRPGFEPQIGAQQPTPLRRDSGAARCASAPAQRRDRTLPRTGTSPVFLKRVARSPGSLGRLIFRAEKLIIWANKFGRIVSRGRDVEARFAPALPLRAGLITASRNRRHQREKEHGASKISHGTRQARGASPWQRLGAHQQARFLPRKALPLATLDELLADLTDAFGRRKTAMARRQS